jgi:hypothetical protein
MCIAEGVSVFDAIELDDNETLSWEEFRRFFDDNEGRSWLIVRQAHPDCTKVENCGTPSEPDQLHDY